MYPRYPLELQKIRSEELKTSRANLPKKGQAEQDCGFVSECRIRQKMGISASKRVKTSLTNSAEFNSACDSAYSHCVSLTQHAFQGVLPYQLPAASDHIHATILSSCKQPIILKWVPSPPTRSQIDSALRVIVTRQQLNKKEEEEEELMLGPAQLREWAVILYAEAVAVNAGKAILARVPIGAAGIVGIGAATRTNMNLVGAAIGIYALGVATSVYLSLSS